MTLGTRNRRALSANFQAMDARLQRDARKLVAKYRDKQFHLTRELCPVGTRAYTRGTHQHDPGFLRSMIRARTSDDGLAYEIGWREEDFIEKGEPPYFIFTEFGTRFMAARPCVFPARDKIAPEFKRDWSAAQRRAFRRRGAA
jgi:hypothetical protein